MSSSETNLQRLTTTPRSTESGDSPWRGFARAAILLGALGIFGLSQTTSERVLEMVRGGTNFDLHLGAFGVLMALGVEGLTVYARSGPLNLAVGVLALGLLLLPAWLTRAPVATKPAAMSLRFVAFAIDFAVCLAVLQVAITLVVLAVAGWQGGALSWEVDRILSPPASRVCGGLALISPFAALFVFSLPAWRGWQSPGGLVLGLHLAHDGRLSLWRAMARTALGFLTLAAAIFSVPAALRREDRRLWHDRASGTSMGDSG